MVPERKGAQILGIPGGRVAKVSLEFPVFSSRYARADENFVLASYGPERADTISAHAAAILTSRTRRGRF